MLTASASIAIPTPSRYMNRLAKHFEHRVAVTRDESSANVSFPDAPCNMLATDTHLKVQLEARGPEELARLQEVIERHLRQVASQETFEVSWNSV